MRADVLLDIGRKTFASGLLPELITLLRRSRPGDLVAVVADEEGVGLELETWCRFTGNPLLETTVENAVHLSVRGCSFARRHSAGGLAALALRKLRLQPALRLLLRAFVPHCAATGARARAGAADRS